MTVLNSFLIVSFNKEIRRTRRREEKELKSLQHEGLHHITGGSSSSFFSSRLFSTQTRAV